MNHSFFFFIWCNHQWPHFLLMSCCSELFPLQRNDRETGHCSLKLVILWWNWFPTNGWYTVEELNKPGFFCNLDEVKCIFLSLSLYSVQLINLSRIFVCRLKCPRITPRQLSSNVNNGPSPGTHQQKDAFQLAKSSLSSMMGYVYVWGDCWLSSKFSGIFIQNWKLVWARRLVSLGK